MSFAHPFFVMSYRRLGILWSDVDSLCVEVDFDDLIFTLDTALEPLSFPNRMHSPSSESRDLFNTLRDEDRDDCLKRIGLSQRNIGRQHFSTEQNRRKREETVLRDATRGRIDDIGHPEFHM